MHAPSLFPGPKPNHLISLCLIEWLVWKYVLLVHVQLSPGNPAIFFPKKTRFLQNDQKKTLQNASVLQKCPWNGTWVKPFHSGNIHRDVFVKCPCAFRRRRLAQNAGPGIRVRPFPCNFPNKMALVKCPCASRLLIQTCRQETLGSFYRDRAKLLRDLSWRSSAGICKRSLTPTELL